MNNKQAPHNPPAHTEIKPALAEQNFCPVCGASLSPTRVFCSRNCATVAINRRRRTDPLVRIKRGIAIDQNNGCWVWQRRRFPNGYGCLKLNGRNHIVSRVMFVLTYGKLPPGRYAHHKCANKSCCNPRHLEALSPYEHVERSPKFLGFVNRHKSHCVNGHEFSEENTYIDSRGGRHCRKCRVIRNIQWRRKKTNNL